MARFVTGENAADSLSVSTAVLCGRLHAVFRRDGRVVIVAGQNAAARGREC